MADFWDSGAPFNGEAPWHANRASIQTVVVQGGVTNIGNRAFKDCSNLHTIRIESPVSIIGRQAFFNCTSLSAVVIPNSVTEVEGEAFLNCSNLKTVTIADGKQILKFTGYGNYYPVKYDWFKGCQIETLHIGCEKYTSVYDVSLFSGMTTLQKLTIGNTTKLIEAKAFYGCTGLIEINLGNGLTTIGYDAFYGCGKVSSLVIPGSVNSIGSNAFSNCIGLQSVRIEHGSVPLEFETSSYGTNLGAFYGSSIGNMYLDRNIGSSHSGYGAVHPPFEGNTRLNTLTIGDNVTSINADFFNGCTGLTEVDFGSGLESIGNSAFYGCTGLATINWGSKLATIGSSAFYGCTNLTGALNIPVGVTTIGRSAFFGCGKVSSLVIPGSVNSIGSNAFSNCTGLQSVRIENSSMSLIFETSSYGTNLGAFYGSSIGNLYLDRNLESSHSGYGAAHPPFEGNTRLNTLTIGDNVTSINADFFNGCTGLTEVNFGSGLETIDNSAFYGCTGLTKINLNSKLKTIENNAFYGCSGLKSITSKNSTPPTAGNNCFYNVYATCKLYVPVGSANSYKVANEWKKFFDNNNLIEDASIGVDDAVANRLSIYPNPAEDELFIKSDLQIEKVEIYSLAGALLQSDNNFNEQISVVNLPVGVYMLKVYSDKGIDTSTFVKQ